MPEVTERLSNRYIISLSLVTAVFALIYYLVHHPELDGALSFSLLDEYYFTGAIIALMTIKIAFHLIRIKLIFWRIFLQTFLNTSSKVYKFFSHGYFVRVLAVALAIGIAMKVFIFFCLLPVHLSQFIILYCGLIIFTLLKVHDLSGMTNSILREDVSGILKIYLTAFLLATTTGVAVSVWEIYHLDKLASLNVLQIMDMTTTQIDPSNNIFLRVVRIIMRHLYAYELLVQQLVFIPVLGKPLYFLYLVISEGSVTFFGVFLLALPFRAGVKNENA